MKELVIIHNDEPRAGTWGLSQGFKVEHRALTKLVKKYKSEFEEFGVIASAMQQPTSKEGGRPIEEFLLLEEQTLYLGTLLTNNETVRKFKRVLVKQFTKIRKLVNKLLSQKQNQDWLENRSKGIRIRREETDVIKKFIEYAIARGSKSAHTYYMNISKMENQALFLLKQKFPNLREVLDFRQLAVVQCADQIVSRWLEEGMKAEMEYKAIFKLAQKKVTEYAEIIGRSPIPNSIEFSVQPTQLALDFQSTNESLPATI